MGERQDVKVEPGRLGRLPHRLGLKRRRHLGIGAVADEVENPASASAAASSGVIWGET